MTDRLDPVQESPRTRPIRVLYIIDSLLTFGGTEGCLLRLTKQLPRDQFECRVITFRTIPEARRLLDQFDCPVDHWHLDNIHDWNAWTVARRLWRLVRDEKIDLVHSFFQTADIWAGPIAKLAGAKVLISSRRDMGFLRRPKHNLAYRLLNRMYDEIQTVSEGVRQYTLERDKTEPARTVTILNGIDPSVMVPPDHVKRIRASLDLPPGAPIVITVANPRHVKGIDILVRAAVVVGSKIPDARILVVGNFGGSDADKAFTKGIMQLTETLGAGRWIKFLGTSHTVPTLLKASDVFVLPSRSEGLSNALLEAMRAGLPCIATAVGGNPEVVVDGRTGFLVPPEDTGALADRILQLLRDREMRVRMGEASRQRLLENFTVQKMTDQVVASYQRTLAEKGIRVNVPKLQAAAAGIEVSSSV